MCDSVMFAACLLSACSLVMTSFAIETSISLSSPDHIKVLKENVFKRSTAECVKWLRKVALTDSLKTSYDIREVAHP